MHHVYQLYVILLLARKKKTIFQTCCVAIFNLKTLIIKELKSYFLCLSLWYKQDDMVWVATTQGMTRTGCFDICAKDKCNLNLLASPDFRHVIRVHPCATRLSLQEDAALGPSFRCSLIWLSRLIWSNPASIIFICAMKPGGSFSYLVRKGTY